MFPAGRYLATTKEEPSDAVAFPTPNFFVLFHTIAVKWPTGGRRYKQGPRKVAEKKEILSNLRSTYQAEPSALSLSLKTKASYVVYFLTVQLLHEQLRYETVVIKLTCPWGESRPVEIVLLHLIVPSVGNILPCRHITQRNLNSEGA